MHPTSAQTWTYQAFVLVIIRQSWRGTDKQCFWQITTFECALSPLSRVLRLYEEPMSSWRVFSLYFSHCLSSTFYNSSLYCSRSLILSIVWYLRVQSIELQKLTVHFVLDILTLVFVFRKVEYFKMSKRGKSQSSLEEMMWQYAYKYIGEETVHKLTEEKYTPFWKYGKYSFMYNFAPYGGAYIQGLFPNVYI